MSDPQNEAGRSSSSPAAAKPPAKPRHPVERLLVWGVIVIGLAVVVVEATALYGYTRTLSNLAAALEETENTREDNDNITIDELPTLIVGFPSVKLDGDEYTGFAHYRWNSLAKNYAVHIRYRMRTGIVTNYATDEAPMPEEPRRPDDSADAPLVDIPPPVGGGGSDESPDGGGPRGGGRPLLNFADLDRDGDGKLSLDEAPERMRENFAEVDTNSDGFIDAEEFAARRRGRGPRDAAPDDDASRPNRPTRPAPDSPDAPAQQPPAEAPPTGSAPASDANP